MTPTAHPQLIIIIKNYFDVVSFIFEKIFLFFKHNSLGGIESSNADNNYNNSYATEFFVNIQ